MDASCWKFQRVVMHARLVHVPRVRAVENAPVVPHHDVAHGPAVFEHPRRLARPRQQLFEHHLRVVVGHAGDSVHVATDEQRLASCRGVRAHDRMLDRHHSSTRFGGEDLFEAADLAL